MVYEALARLFEFSRPKTEQYCDVEAGFFLQLADGRCVWRLAGFNLAARHLPLLALGRVSMEEEHAVVPVEYDATGKLDDGRYRAHFFFFPP